MPHAYRMRGAAHKPQNVRAVIAVAVVFFAALAGWRGSHARTSAAAPALPQARMPHAGERILVFSPHPDDETLGLGGFIHEARRRGADVHVAFLTSGDGFSLCAAARYRRWPNRSRMRQLAADREEEARTALSKLGVPRDHVDFFGYPDRGLATLWQSNWSPKSPFRSPYTGESAVFGQASIRPSQPFCGVAVLQDVEALLRRYRPDRVYYPDPSDDHPDHWAASCFVQLALERLWGEPGLGRAEHRTYLIHRGEWPEPMRTDRSLSLLPPTALTRLGSRWEAIPLRRENVDAKAAALRAYRSQEVLAGNFLNAFLRQNELLNEWPAADSSRVGTLRSSEGTGTSGLLGVSAEHAFSDATGDRFARARWGAVDFTRIEVEGGSAEVTLSAEMREPAAGWPAYYLYWKPVSGTPEAIRTRRYRISGYRCDPPAARFAIDGRRLQVTIPRTELAGSTRIMVAASAWSGPLLLDRTAWRVIDLQVQQKLTARTPREKTFRQD